MKKLIYIVLIVILLVLIGKYVKEKSNEITPEPVTVVEEDSFSYDIVDPVTGEVIGTSEGNIVTTTTYDYDNADGMIMENDEYVEEEIIEENPEMTQFDDETIVAE
ncbi:MAG: hypothetical protein LBR70_06120 [Lactobacillaceae bacterium]|jgi:major membrane immunogen (membrane-anchored lipoprotein)|nr:hypothetical protein [Lactobacillaceae bacterium]